MGTGLIYDPFTLAEALNNNRISNGDRVILRDGSYTGLGNITITRGSNDDTHPIQFIAYPGERPIINGATLKINAPNVWFYGIEFDDTTFTSRTSTQETSGPTDIDGRTLTGSDSSSGGVKYIACHMRNGRHGGGGAVNALGTEWNACHFYYNGWKSPANSYGHGLYPQNDSPIKYIKKCIFHDNYGYGLHAYASGGKLNNFYITHNTSFCNGSLWGEFYGNLFIGGVDFNNLNYLNNLTYYTSDYINGGHQIGYGLHTISGVIVKNNIFAREASGLIFILKNVAPDEMTGNQFFGDISGFLSDDYPSNTYGSAGTYGDQSIVYAHDYVLIDADGDGIKDKIVSVDGSHQADRANATIYNQSAADTVNLDVSAIFPDGTDLNVHNCQDYFGDIQNLTVASGLIAIDMQVDNRTVEIPVGASAPPKTFPNFGCFVLERA